MNRRPVAITKTASKGSFIKADEEIVKETEKKKKNKKKMMMKYERKRSTSLLLTSSSSSSLVRLVKYEDLPEYLQDNEFIRDYYRCEWPLKDIVLSVFTWHNETLNIWTHLVGFMVFAGLTAVSLMDKATVENLVTRFSLIRPPMEGLLMILNPTNDSCVLFNDLYPRESSAPSMLHVNEGSDVVPKWPWFVFLGGAMSCLVFSTLSHIFACRSRRFNFFFWRLDYSGISLMIVCSFFPPIYYSFSCHPHWRFFYLASITVVGICAIFTLIAPGLSTKQFRSFRAKLFLTMGFSGVIPALHAVVICFDHSEILGALGYEILMGFLYAVGAAFYITRIPEKWRPGAFDIVGHSHQIFHIFVVAAALAHSFAVLVIMDWRQGLPGCKS